MCLRVWSTRLWSGMLSSFKKRLSIAPLEDGPTRLWSCILTSFLEHLVIMGIGQGGRPTVVQTHLKDAPWAGFAPPGGPGLPPDAEKKGGFLLGSAGFRACTDESGGDTS